MARAIGVEDLSTDDALEQNPAAEEAIGYYRVWASDNQIYGPITISILKQWVVETRVQRDTWVFVEEKREWRQADRIDDLLLYFPVSSDTAQLERETTDATGLDLVELRQFAIFSGLSNRDLAQFLRFSTLVTVKSGESVMRRGEPGDAVYFVLSGSVRARILVGREEKVLAKIPAGELFGEMAMLTQTARSADVIAEEETRLLQFTSAAFRVLIEEKPAAAAPLLYFLASLMASRVLEVNQRFQQEVATGFVWR
jgi:hypothetical protein